MTLYHLSSYPLTRGKRDATSIARDQLGSSPLTRGKLDEGLEDAAEGRLIPARAGKTAHERVKASRVRAHPRSRGENATGTTP